MPTISALRRLVALLLLPVLVAALLAACGGDDSGDAVEASDDDTDQNAGDDDADGDDDNGSGGGGDAKFCGQINAADEAFDQLDDESSFDDPTAYGEVFGRVSTVLKSIDPPDEIAADWNATVRALDAMVTAFAGIDFSDLEAMEGIEDELAALQEEFGDLEESGERITAYVLEECGIDLDD